MRPPQRSADRIVATWIVRTARWVYNEVPDRGDVLAPPADAIVSDQPAAFRVPVGSGRLVQ